jgi:hypothetical protein
MGLTWEEEVQRDVSARENLREQARQGATNSGLRPADRYSQHELDWAFADHESELVELDELAQRVAAEKEEQAIAREHERDVRDLAKQILEEEDRAVHEKRLAAATKEARRRLGGAKP